MAGARHRHLDTGLREKALESELVGDARMIGAHHARIALREERLLIEARVELRHEADRKIRFSGRSSPACRCRAFRVSSDGLIQRRAVLQTVMQPIQFIA